MMCPYCNISYGDGESCFCHPPMPRAATPVAVAAEPQPQAVTAVPRKRFRSIREGLSAPMVARAAEAAIVVAAVPTGRLVPRHA